MRSTHLFPFSQLRREMDQAMNALWPALPGGLPGGLFRDGASARVFPALNVWEQADELFVEAELPGLKPDNIDIAVEGDVLTIKGERGDATPDGAAWHRRERGVGAFSRVLKLPTPVDAGRVQANFRDGVLTITLPKSEAAKPRKIQVASA
jgi:HSP20 family protein